MDVFAHHTKRIFSTDGRHALALALVTCVGQLICGCCGDVIVGFDVAGVLIDASTSEPLSSGTYGGSIMQDGSVLQTAPATARFKNQEGEFFLMFSRLASACDLDVLLCQHRNSVAVPDEVELTIVREGCSQTLTIPLTNDELSRTGCMSGLFELSDPVVVPACEE